MVGGDYQNRAAAVLNIVGMTDLSGGRPRAGAFAKR
jgi:hypothetical protein